MINLQLRVNPQGLLFPGSDTLVSPAHVATVVGRFYEVLAQGIVGGEIVGMGNDWCQPDIEIWEKETWVEVKATSKRSQLKLQTEQLDRYAELERSKFPFKKPRINYLIFVHGLERIHKTLKTESNLIGELAANTLLGILLPFRFARKLPYSHAVKWFQSDGTAYEYRLISTSFLRKVLTEPSLLGMLDRGEEFSFTKYKIGGIIVDENLMKPFPLLKIWGKEKSQMDIPFEKIA
jgi:hypothetical protein